MLYIKSCASLINFNQAAQCLDLFQKVLETGKQHVSAICYLLKPGFYPRRVSDYLLSDLNICTGTGRYFTVSVQCVNGILSMFLSSALRAHSEQRLDISAQFIVRRFTELG